MGVGKKILAGCGIGCGAMIAAVLVALIVLGAAVQAGLLPDPDILSGKTLRKKHREVAEGITPFEPGESLRWFYSAGVIRFEADLQYMTDRRLVVAWRAEEDVQHLELRLTDIRVVEVLSDASDLEDGLVQVSGPDEDEPLFVSLSNNRGRDEWVIEQLRKAAKRGLALAQEEETAEPAEDIQATDQAPAPPAEDE